MDKKVYTYEPRIMTKPSGKGLVYYVTYCVDGERKFHRAHKRFCECEQTEKQKQTRPCDHLLAAQNALSTIEDQISPESVYDAPVQTLFATWEQEAGHVRDSTQTLYLRIFKIFKNWCDANHISHASGITERRMAEFKQHMKTVKFKKHHAEEKNYSTTYISICLRTLRAVFAWAVRKQWMDSNPLSNAGKAPSEKLVESGATNERNPLSKAEVTKVLQHTKGQWHDVAVVFLYTGMRIGELSNLTWKQVTETTIRIEMHDGWVPKWGESRVIPQHTDVKAVLDRLRAAKGQSPYVFHTSTGKRINEDNIRRFFEVFFNSHGIVGEEGSGVTPHCFRHTLATNLLQSNMPPTTVRDLLGHKSLETTMIYYHRLERRNAELLNKFSY